MSSFKVKVLKSLLDGMYRSGVHRCIEPWSKGMGLIFMLHRIRPEERIDDFSPNGFLEVTPEFLDAAIRRIRDLGWKIIDLDEAYERLQHGKQDEPFVCFNIDDGYIDNFTHAFPIFDKHRAPFTIYLATGFPDGTAELWWLVIEQIVRHHAKVEIELNGEMIVAETSTTKDKGRAFDRLARKMLDSGPEERARAFKTLCNSYGIDGAALCTENSMTWTMIEQLVKSDVARIEAHTVDHQTMSKQNLSDLRQEIERCRDRIEQVIGHKAQHFAYPFGDPSSAGPREFDLIADLGFKTATTTRKGVLFPEHRDVMTALPRVSLNGEFQSIHYVDLFLSGAPFGLANRFQRVDAA